jgi:hypothetical protein
MGGRGHQRPWADEVGNLDDGDTAASLYDEGTRSYNVATDAGWHDELEVKRGTARYRLNRGHGFLKSVVSAHLQSPSCSAGGLACSSCCEL